MRKLIVRIHVLFAAVFLLGGSALAQVVGPAATPAQGLNLYTMWFIQGRVKTLQGDPVGGAKVIDRARERLCLTAKPVDRPPRRVPDRLLAKSRRVSNNSPST